MTVAYAPPVSNCPVDPRVIEEAVLEGPAFIRTRAATRWHRVRSSYLSLQEWRPDELRQVWHYWCGPATGTWREPILTDTPPDDEPLCGTCMGRATGVDPDSRWLYTPTLNLSPPKVCPGSRRIDFARESAWNRGDCLVCGEHVQLRAYGHWSGQSYGPQNHAPGPDLVDGCERHGWKQLIRCADDTITCRCNTRPLRPGETHP